MEFFYEYSVQMHLKCNKNEGKSRENVIKLPQGKPKSAKTPLWNFFFQLSIYLEALFS